MEILYCCELNYYYWQQIKQRLKDNHLLYYKADYRTPEHRHYYLTKLGESTYEIVLKKFAAFGYEPHPDEGFRQAKSLFR